MLIPLKAIEPSPLNPRKSFPEKALKELAATIDAAGLLQPLLVREHATKAGVYELVDGERRWRALTKFSSITEVETSVVKMTDAQARLAMMISFLQREGVNEMEEAQGFQEMMKDGITVDEIAKGIGNRSKKYVWDRLRLCTLIDNAATMVSRHEITAGHGILIARLKPADQVRAINEIKTAIGQDRPMSVRNLDNYLDNRIRRKLNTAPFALDVQLQDVIACNGCPDRDKDKCLNPSCFETKIDLHIQAQVDKHPSLVLLSGNYQSEHAGKEKELSNVLYRKDYTEDPKGKETGIIVSDYDKGHIIKISRNTKQGRKIATDGEKKLKIQTKAAEIARERILALMMAKTIALDKRVLSLVTDPILQQATTTAAERIAAHFKLLPPTTGKEKQPSNRRKAAAEAITTLKWNAGKLILAALYCGQMKDSPHHLTALEIAAKDIFKIDVKEIRLKALKEQTAAAKKSREKAVKALTTKVQTSAQPKKPTKKPAKKSKS